MVAGGVERGVAVYTRVTGVCWGWLMVVWWGGGESGGAGIHM